MLEFTIRDQSAVSRLPICLVLLKSKHNLAATGPKLETVDTQIRELKLLTNFVNKWEEEGGKTTADLGEMGDMKLNICSWRLFIT